jgi:hypothetical protein
MPGHGIELDVFVGNIYFSWYKSVGRISEFKNIQASAQTIVDSLRPRPLFDVPKENGLCLPYLFIADDGKGKHEIGMTYRLKAHPDITINLRSKTAESTPKKGDWESPDSVTDRSRTIMFWAGWVAQAKSSRSVWRFPSMRPTRLAGRLGLKSFVGVVWEQDETEESYTYHAIARGDPDHPETVPDVQLVIEQQRQNALKKGIKPLTKEEVLDLAAKVSASVTLRPTQ